MQKALERTKARWAQFKNDVWNDASIGPVAGILLSTLAVLIVWLTIEYAPGAVERAEQAASETKHAGEGVISPFWGNVTIALMTMATLAAGFEPIIGRCVERWWLRTGKHWWNFLSRPARWILFAPIALIIVPAKVASFAWSLVDYILARPVAILAGTAWRGWVRRYAHFATLMLIAVGAVLAVEMERLAPDIALAAIVIDLVAILAIVRRWSWIESDRDTFLIERGEREGGKGTLRVGFTEDLRDEALTALACLFFLIPLGLDLVQQSTAATGAPAFAFSGTDPMPSEPWPRFVTWLGYFGVELAKTVPFVDWSEVFHVANGSPIEAQTSLGSQLAFVLRAGLDLLFLATVLQAVQIATRLREQKSAFANNRLPILEPFAEQLELTRAFEQLNDDLDVRLNSQPVILDFPRYDATRLRELIDGTAEAKDIRVRMVAAVLLQKDYETSPEGKQDIPRFWTEQTSTQLAPNYRTFIQEVASGLDPDDPESLESATRRARLLNIVEEDWNDSRSRAAATRALGRTRLGAGEQKVLLGRLVSDKELEVRVAAALVLAKAGVVEALPATERLRDRLPADAIILAQAVAFAIAHAGAPADEIADHFEQDLRPHALWAARIQLNPIAPEEASRREPGVAVNQTVLLTPGERRIPKSFLMGPPDNERGAMPREHPQREVAIKRSFALGRFPVTTEEYLAFCRATGRRPLQHSAHARRPAIEISWYDARAYCSWLRAVTGDAYRLPSEAEWEFACRSGTNTTYSWGLDWDNAKANSIQSGLSHPSDVGSYQSNDWGLWDMHGNVFEWCADPWHESYEGAPTDQRPWLENGDFSSRVLRGGSWGDVPQVLRSALRDRFEPSIRFAYFGFRVARTTFVSAFLRAS